MENTGSCPVQELDQQGLLEDMDSESSEMLLWTETPAFPNQAV